MRMLSSLRGWLWDVPVHPGRLVPAGLSRRLVFFPVARLSLNWLVRNLNTFALQRLFGALAEFLGYLFKHLLTLCGSGIAEAIGHFLLHLLPLFGCLLLHVAPTSLLAIGAARLAFLALDCAFSTRLGWRTWRAFPGLHFILVRFGWRTCLGFFGNDVLGVENHLIPLVQSGPDLGHFLIRQADHHVSLFW